MTDGTTHVVVSRCGAGFALSIACAEFMAKRGHAKAIEWLREPVCWVGDVPCERHDSILVEAVQTLGDEVAGLDTILVVVKIDSPVYRIDRDAWGNENAVTPGGDKWSCASGEIDGWVAQALAMDEGRLQALLVRIDLIKSRGLGGQR